MPKLTIAKFRALIRSLSYVVSLHAAEELEDDNLTILDLESIILSGEIVERQRDAQTREVKFLIRGLTLKGGTAEAAIKLGPTGRLIVITVYVA